MNKVLLVLIGIILVGLGFYGRYLYQQKVSPLTIKNFDECVAAGNPVMDSYPAQCRAGGKTFLQEIGNELEKTDLITIENPRPTQEIGSPLIITGKARGQWYFEADFPVVLLDDQNKEIVRGVARASGDWMTEEFVPFSAELTFSSPATEKGWLILGKSNPSGLTENDDALRVPITFK